MPMLYSCEDVTFVASDIDKDKDDDNDGKKPSINLPFFPNDKGSDKSELNQIEIMFDRSNQHHN